MDRRGLRKRTRVRLEVGLGKRIILTLTLSLLLLFLPGVVRCGLGGGGGGVSDPNVYGRWRRLILVFDKYIPCRCRLRGGMIWLPVVRSCGASNTWLARRRYDIVWLTSCYGWIYTLVLVFFLFHRLCFYNERSRSLVAVVGKNRE